MGFPLLEQEWQAIQLAESGLNEWKEMIDIEMIR